MISGRIVVIPRSTEEAFITYPNPFGRNQDYANIRLFLEDDGDVEIRIFTLVGELVWTKILPNQPQGYHDGLYNEQYRWDGKNDRGKTVLNGVYLCVLRTTVNGSTKTFVTKVAYIK